MKNASHVTNKIGFVIPVYKPLLKFYYWFGLKLYDLISGDSFFPKSKIINKKKVQELLPNINNKGLLGGVCFFDGQLKVLLNIMILSKVLMCVIALVIIFMKLNQRL